MNESNWERRKGVVTCVWGEKSKLERNLIIALMVIIILFIGLLLFVIIKPAVMKKKCATSACLTAASDIVNRINPQIDPCVDFFKFSCGNYQSHTNPILATQNKIERELIRIVKNPIQDQDHYLLKMQKMLYQACLENDTLALGTINDTITELGWPVVVGYQWKEETFDWQELIFKLRKKGYPFEAMLKVDVVKNGTTYTVEVSPPQIDAIDQAIERYQKYMTDIAVAFGADARRAENEMEKVFYFGQILKKISDRHSGYVTTWVQNYQERNADIDWLNYINNILYPVDQISLGDYVNFPKEEFVTEFYTFLYRTPKRVIANYIIWSALETSMPFLPEELRNMRSAYECQSGLKRAHVERGVFCKHISKSFLQEPSDIMLARKYLPKNRRSKVKMMVGSIKHELKELLTKTTWLDEASRKKSLDKLENVIDVIGTPGDYFNDSIFTDHCWPGDHEKIARNGSFFQMLLTQRYKYQNNVFYKLRQKRDRREIDRQHGFITKVNGMYDGKRNSIILSVGILQDIFYDEDRPMYLNYGALGTAIGHKLTHAFSEIGSYFGNDGQEEKIWSEDSARAYQTHIQCMVDVAESFYANSSQDKINGSFTLDENVADYTGVRLAYSAYKKWIEEHGQERQLTGLHYTPYQLFWISTITHQCFTSVSEDDHHADGTFRATSPFRNNVDFAEDFNCATDSPMNPPKKCQVF